MKKVVFILVLVMTVFAIPAMAQLGAPKSGKECVQKMCGAIEGFTAVTNSVSDVNMLEKAYEPLIPLMENMTKEMKPYRDYVLDEEDRGNVKTAMMNWMTALNKFMGAPIEVVEQQVDLQVKKINTLKDLIDDAPGK